MKEQALAKVVGREGKIVEMKLSLTPSLEKTLEGFLLGRERSLPHSFKEILSKEIEKYGAVEIEKIRLCRGGALRAASYYLVRPTAILVYKEGHQGEHSFSKVAEYIPIRYDTFSLKLLVPVFITTNKEIYQKEETMFFLRYYGALLKTIRTISPFRRTENEFVYELMLAISRSKLSKFLESIPGEYRTFVADLIYDNGCFIKDYVLLRPYLYPDMVDHYVDVWTLISDYFMREVTELSSSKFSLILGTRRLLKLQMSLISIKSFINDFVISSKDTIDTNTKGYLMAIKNMMEKYDLPQILLNSIQKEIHFFEYEVDASYKSIMYFDEFMDSLSITSDKIVFLQSYLVSSYLFLITLFQFFMALSELWKKFFTILSILGIH